MPFQAWLEIGLTLLIAGLVSIPVGGYLARVVTDRKTLLDPIFDPFDNLLYLLIGRHACTQPMNWKAYTAHMLMTNAIMGAIIYLILVFQDHLPLNPMHFAGMEPILAFNTAISFITNTDWQGYGGETTLSNFSQMAAITFPMFTSATTGFVVAMAFIRAFTVKDGGANLGNFYRDLVRFTTRVLMPAAFVLALVMIWQGTPQTLHTSVTAHRKTGNHPGVTSSADPSVGHPGAYRLVRSSTVWLGWDGQCGNAWLLRGALCIRQLGGQQWLGFRRAKCQYALVQFGDRLRHPDRPLSSDHLHDGGCRIGGRQAHGGGHGRDVAHGYLSFWRVLAGYHSSGRSPDIRSSAGTGTDRRALCHEAATAFLMMDRASPRLQK